MKKLTSSFIAAAVVLSIYSQNSFADTDPCVKTDNGCFVDVPMYDRPLVDGDINTLPVEVSADNFEVNLLNKAIYSGNVHATQGNRTVTSDNITVEQVEKNRNMLLRGNVIYQDNIIEMEGEQADMNLDTNEIEIQDNQYHLVGRLGRGQADKTAFLEGRYVVLNNGSFTACPVNDSSWNIEGSEIIYDNQEQLLEIWNARFKIGPVPVLYLPYLQLPTGNTRRSGLLMPTFSYNSIGGFDISQPVYWNIAPNYDATLTPRIIQRRGFQLQTEIRYLNDLGFGTVAFDWLGHDQLYSRDRADNKGVGYSDNDYRWLFHWNNDRLINENWRVSVNTTRVSDYQYINDLGSSYASETDGYLNQYYKLGYADKYWDIDLHYLFFQGLSDSIKYELYRTEPQLNINYYNNDIDNLNIKNFSQVSHFVTSGDKNPDVWRFHIEPTLDYTLMSSWASITTEAGFMATHYDQDIPKYNQNSHLEKNVNRFMPKFGIDAKMIFERNVELFDGYTQTLEPRVKYLYIPYRNQSNINNYDSSLLQSDYIGLFRDQLYSGLDRIASSNKVTTGVTTRFYNENKVEKFNISLGQIYYFSQSRTGVNDPEASSNEGLGSITWATDAFWRIDNDIIARSGIQYDTRINKVSLASAILEYRHTENQFIQLSYRYANKNYIDSISLSNYTTPYQQSISQIGFMSAWPLTDSVSVVGSMYYDLDNKQSTDSFVGLHYADCCWGVFLQYGRKITDWNSVSEQSEYENKFSINFELRGLNTNDYSVAKMLNFGLLPYKTAFE